VTFGQAAYEDVTGQQGRLRAYEGGNRSGGPGIGGSNETDTINNADGIGDWRYSDGWNTLTYHVTPGTRGGTGANRTHWEVWAQHDLTLFPAEAGVHTKVWDVLYTSQYDSIANGLGSPAFPGWNAILCAIYHNGAVFTTTAFNFDYDQVIFSKAAIPAPNA
jgi:hypothetical protein